MNITKKQLKEMVAELVKSQLKEQAQDGMNLYANSNFRDANQLNAARREGTKIKGPQEYNGHVCSIDAFTPGHVLISPPYQKKLENGKTQMTNSIRWHDFIANWMPMEPIEESKTRISESELRDMIRQTFESVLKEGDKKFNFEKGGDDDEDEHAKWQKFLRSEFESTYGGGLDLYDTIPREERIEFLTNCLDKFNVLMSESKDMCEDCGKSHGYMDECGVTRGITTVMDEAKDKDDDDDKKDDSDDDKKGGFVPFTKEDGGKKGKKDDDDDDCNDDDDDKEEVTVEAFRRIVRQMIMEESASARASIISETKKYVLGRWIDKNVSTGRGGGYNIRKVFRHDGVEDAAFVGQFIPEEQFEEKFGDAKFVQNFDDIPREVQAGWGMKETFDLESAVNEIFGFGKGKKDLSDDKKTRQASTTRYVASVFGYKKSSKKSAVVGNIKF